MISRILVSTDGSKAAQKAVLCAIDLARQLNAAVTILSVIDTRPFTGQTVPSRRAARHVIEPIEDYLREAAEGYAGDVVKLCKKKGVQATAVVTAGHPVENIIREARKAKAGMIVMGSHGKSAFTAAVLGSVTYGVIHEETKIPVLIVRG